jgi:hypothetical protein
VRRWGLRGSFFLSVDVVGDRVYVERPRHVEDYLWVDEELDDEDVEDEPWDDDSDEEENDVDEEGGDEHVEPVFVLLLVVTSVTTAA